jgi:ABC-type multidrug transport system fused ATPase/permease subunit
MFAAFKEAMRLLRTRDRRVIILIIAAQCLLSLLDLLGVALLGLVATLAASSVTNSVPDLVQQVISRLGLSSQSLAQTALTLACVAAVLLVGKSVLSFFLTRRAFKFLARRQAQISGDLAQDLLSRPLLEVQSKISQEVAHSLTKGVNAATLGILGSSIVIVSELSLIAVLAAGMAFIDFWVMAFTIVFFSSLGYGLHRALAGWAARLGARMTSAEIDSYTSIQEALRTYREITVSARRSLYVERFRSLRWDSASVLADVQIMNQISKYVFEIAIIVGGGLLVVSQLALRDLSGAVGVIAIFLAAASRLMPALLRLQAAGLEIRVAIGISRPTFELAAELKALTGAKVAAATASQTAEATFTGLAHGRPGFVGAISVKDVSLTYPGSARIALDHVSIEIAQGTSIGLAGSSGAGKSTLADLLLGVVKPDVGQVLISGMDPSRASECYPGAISYVPQEVAVVGGTIRENVALGLPLEKIPDRVIVDALVRSHLWSFLSQERDGLDTMVGENGVQLSGGQKQRLGVARALLTNPKVLVLDEATSALDSETEQAISETIAELEGDVTLVVIAHRLATIRNCDRVAFLKSGKLVAVGNFSEVRRKIPEFDAQARLLGL